jgi:hypothetical protein
VGGGGGGVVAVAVAVVVVVDAVETVTVMVVSEVARQTLLGHGGEELEGVVFLRVLEELAVTPV